MIPRDKLEGKYPDLPQYILANARKQPVDAQGQLINPFEPENWTTLERAHSLRSAVAPFCAFIVTPPFFVLDIDKCRDPITGNYDARALDWGRAFSGFLMEISQSQTGIHIMGCCQAGLDAEYMNRADGIEFYQQKRLVVLGSEAQGDATLDGTKILRTRLKPRPTATGSSLRESGPIQGYTGPADDEVLLPRALNATGSIAQQFGDAPHFRDLWERRTEVLAHFFPTQGKGPYDRSAADFALLKQLAFWTGKDLARMERLWLSSPLAEGRTNEE